MLFCKIDINEQASKNGHHPITFLHVSLNLKYASKP